MKPISITTTRLYLRNTRKGDAESLFKNYCSDISCSQFLTRKPHKNLNETALFLNKWCSEGWSDDSQQFAWVVALRKSNEAIGNFIIIAEENKAQIHFGIGSTFQGQGLITEAGYAVIEWLRVQQEIQRIWTVCHSENFASIRVLEKLGFKKEGILDKQLLFPALENKDCSCFIYTRDH